MCWQVLVTKNKKTWCESYLHLLGAKKADQGDSFVTMLGKVVNGEDFVIQNQSCNKFDL